MSKENTQETVLTACSHRSEKHSALDDGSRGLNLSPSWDDCVVTFKDNTLYCYMYHACIHIYVLGLSILEGNLL